MLVYKPASKKISKPNKILKYAYGAEAVDDKGQECGDDEDDEKNDEGARAFAFVVEAVLALEFVRSILLTLLIVLVHFNSLSVMIYLVNYNIK
jgi:hypothetical protein